MPQVPALSGPRRAVPDACDIGLGWCRGRHWWRPDRNDRKPNGARISGERRSFVARSRVSRRPVPEQTRQRSLADILECACLPGTGNDAHVQHLDALALADPFLQVGKCDSGPSGRQGSSDRARSKLIGPAARELLRACHIVFECSPSLRRTVWTARRKVAIP